MTRDETTNTTATDDAKPADPEVEGHLLTNPYLLELPVEAYHERMRDDIAYERPPAKERAPGPAKRLLDKVRGRTNG